MGDLVDRNGAIRWGFYPEPVERINAEDYPLETVLGRRVPGFLKKRLLKHFVFVGAPCDGFVWGLAVVDLKYLANGFFYLFDRREGRLVESRKLTLPGNKVSLDPRPDRLTARFESGDLSIRIEDGRIEAQGPDLKLEARVDHRRAVPLRICTRTGYRGWVYKQSTTPAAVEGVLRHCDRTYVMTPADARALIDWSCGYMRRDTWWNWAATAAVLPDGRELGFNLSCGVNETSFTESYILLDGRLTKVDACLFEFDPADILKPWRVSSYDRKVDLTFFPEGQRGERVNALLVKSKFTQLMGRFEGRLRTDDGETLEITDRPGWTEDHFALW